ncbi:MAG: L,D-transpeptidase family protein [Ruminococcus sp.]|nr:L,D-transpeptidase family protein [Ruminococcus sp.]
MNKSRIALIALISAVVIVAGVSVFGIIASEAANSSTTQTAVSEKSMAAAVRNQIEKPLTPAKGEVKNLQKTSDESDRIVLTWDQVPDAVSYNVYLCDKDGDNTYKKVAEVTEPTAELAGLVGSNVYWVKVAACISEGIQTIECPATQLKTATKVASIGELEYEHSGEVLGFSWKTDNKYDGYDIYRGSKDNSYQLSLYETIGGDVTEYNDEEVENGDLYTYQVRPFRQTGNEKFSGESATIDLVSGLSSPSGLVAKSANNRVVVYWQDRSAADGYDIYMAKGKHGEYQLVGNTSDTNYASDKLETGETYYFRVQPFAKFDDKTVLGTWSTCDVTINSTGSSSVSSTGTFIEISIEQQHMWFYENGNLIVDTAVVTGNDDGDCNTPTGSYAIQSREEQTTLVGEDYESYVDYWLGFNGGIGIHDASWRDDFGGDIYQGNGSHGCVNTPFDKVQIIFEHVEVGTPVYVY